MMALWCWLTSHRWRVLRASCHVAAVEQERAARLGRLVDPLAGAIAKCDRCGKRWFDECMSCELSPRSVELIKEIGP